MLFNETKIILDLCGGTGTWSEPYRKAGYDVRIIDIKNGQDARLVHHLDDVYGILAAPDCTHLARSGARWWEEKGEEALLEALSIADACVRIAMFTNPVFWALENPVGRLRTFYGPPRLIFQPNEYGSDYTKKTLLWGKFNIPKKLLMPAEPTEGSKIHLMPPSEDRKELRSITPAEFAQAFFEANQ